MTVKVSKNKIVKNPKSCVDFEKVCCVIETGTHTSETNKRSETRVSQPGAANKYSTESNICRTMTIGHSSQDTTALNTESHTVKQLVLRSRNKQINQKSKLSESSNLKNSTSSDSVKLDSPAFTFPYLSSASSTSTQNKNKSIQNSEKRNCQKMYANNYVRLVSGSLTIKSSSSNNSRRELFSYDSSCVSTVTPRTSSTSSSSKSYYKPNGHWASFGMILLVSIILSTFSTSSMVQCVPLGHQAAAGGSDEGSSSSQSDSSRRSGGTMMMSNSRLLELGKSSSMDEPTSLYTLQSKGQIYLPSALKNGPVKAAGEALASPIDLSYAGYAVAPGTGLESDENQPSSNHHSYDVERNAANSDSTSQNRMPIQKLLPLDLDRSVLTGERGDDLDDGNPSSDAAGATGLDFGLKNEIDSDVNEDDDVANGEQPEWETVIDPHLYVLTEWNSEPYQEQFPLLQQQRKRRNSGTGPSLSIVNPLDVLRQRLLLEIARRRMRQSHNQIIANEEILRKIGRRRR